VPASISLVVPIYNPGPHLPVLLQTVTAQQQADEIVLVDDASTDGTWDIIQAYPDPRLRLHRFEHNQGSSAARNHGLDAAQGEFVALLDADDFYLAFNLLDMQRAFLRGHPDHIYVGSSYVRVMASGDFERTVTLAETDTEIRWAGLFSAPWLPSGCMMRRNRVRFAPEQRGCEDNDYFSKLLKIGKGHNLGEIGIGYFMLGGQSHIYGHSNFFNLLRTNRSNLQALGLEASFEDILTLRSFMAGVDKSQSAAAIVQIVFERFKSVSQADDGALEKIGRDIERLANRN